MNASMEVMVAFKVIMAMILAENVNYVTNHA